ISGSSSSVDTRNLQVISRMLRASFPGMAWRAANGFLKLAWRAALGGKGAMRLGLRYVFAGLGCAGLAVGLFAWRNGLDRRGKSPESVRSASEASRSAAPIGLETFPDPNAPGTSAQVFIDQSFFDAAIFDTALPFTGPIRDPRSLEELREAVRG